MVNYFSFRKNLKRAIEERNLTCKTNTHVIRKARITFLKEMGMPESAIDKRVGHIPGSDITREYTRISNTDANNAYGGIYGKSKKRSLKDLTPLRCSECNKINSGHRNRCFNCNSLLENARAVGSGTKEEKMKELLYDVLREKGLLKPMLQEVEKATN